MNIDLDLSLKGMHLVDAFDHVHNLTRADLSSVLLVRTDDQEAVRGMRQKIKETPHCIYIRLGIACDVTKIERELLRNLLPNSSQWKTSHARALPRIRKRFTTGGMVCRCVVIDNTNFVSSAKVSTIIGLMFEFYGVVQFIFLLPEDYIVTWQKEADGPMMNLFLKCLRYKYDIR